MLIKHNRLGHDRPSVYDGGNTRHTSYICYIITNKCVSVVHPNLEKNTKNEHANFASNLGKFIQRAAISINLRKRIIKMQIINTFYGNAPAEFCQIKWLRIYKSICSTFFSYVLRIWCFIFSTSVPPAIQLHLSAVHRPASVMPRRSDRAQIIISKRLSNAITQTIYPFI